MAIRFDEKNKIFYLNTPKTTYAMALTNGEKVLRHLYWGKKLNQISNFEEIFDNAAGWVDTLDGEFDDGMRSERAMLECACDGGCDLRVPAFSAVQDGFQMLVAPMVKSYEIIKGKPDLEGLPHTYVENEGECDTLKVVIEDQAGIRLNLYYAVFNNIDAITRWAVIENISDKALKLDRALSASVDFNERDFEIINLAGSVRRERHLYRNPIMYGIQSYGSNRGVSGHMYDPFMALVRPDTNEKQGECYSVSLVYSGNYTIGTELSPHTGSVRMFAGINPDRFEWTLGEGESFTTPEAVLVYSAEGIGEMSRTYHQLYRTRLCRGNWRDSIRPVLINNWEGTYFEFNEEKILNIASHAKDFGVEMLVLDDGWFGKRDIDNCSLGDWVEHRGKLPDGIESLAEKVEALGLKFGLWFEPECVSPDSDLHRAHPDWHIHIPNRKASLSRDQWILDLSNPEVQDYVVEAVSHILGKAKITYVKWDYNRNMSELGSAYLERERMGELSHRYILGLYRILEELNKRFPDVLFEGCSGGGGRYDAGMLYYMPQTWASDCSDAAERLKIQYGTSLIYPAITMGAHVSAVPNHQVGRTTPLKMRGDVAMFGQFGYELDPAKLSDEEKAEIKAQIEFYKKIRGTIQFGSMYRLSSPFENKCTAWNFISPDGETVVFGLYNVLGKPLAICDTVRLEGLDPDGKYKDEETGKIYGGDELMNIGITRRFDTDFVSEVRVYHKV